MAEYSYQNIRSYEISIWTLRDRFISILKWANMDQKGQVQDPEIILRDDGTQELSFTIPQYYQQDFDRIPNPLWIHLDQQPLIANMHKLKVIFNKNTEDEAILEFLVVSVTEDHTRDEVNITVKAEGLAFHELGKTGYKIKVSQENFEQAQKKWFEEGSDEAEPQMTLQFWNDLIFKTSKGKWRTNWTYEIQMDWSSYGGTRDSNKIYEDAYISSWDQDTTTITPRAIEGLREKWRPVEISDSNYYNATQTIAEQFGVFCRYEYEHNDQYEITGRKIIYYNNYIKDNEGHIDLTYPYTSSAITRTVDNAELTTKLFVQTVEEDNNDFSIMNVDANKTGEDYILNFDYLEKIGAINEDQLEFIKEFEYKIRLLNVMLKDLYERKQAIENSLIDAEADVTFYANAVKFDDEQIADAEEAKNALVAPNGYIPLDGKGFTVVNGDDKGYGEYINMTIEGLDPNSIALYEDRSYVAGANVQYSNIISSFQCVFDEYQNVIRIQNIIRDQNNKDSQVYLVGQYNPRSKYDNIIATFQQRKKLDEDKYEEAVEKVALLNYYLDETKITDLDEEIAAKAGGAGLLLVSTWEQLEEYETPYARYTIPGRIITQENAISLINSLPSSNIFKELTYNVFEQDNPYTSPNVMYFINKYLKEKEELSSKLERMLGPALREGYWKPDSYNNYGDSFFDSFTIPLVEESSPITQYLEFLWDGEKYYTNEEGIIYSANTAGDMQQYLMIDLNYTPIQNGSNLFDIIAQHKREHENSVLFFAYPDPVAFETIGKLCSSLNSWKETAQIGKDQDNNTTIPDYMLTESLKAIFNQSEYSDIRATLPVTSDSIYSENTSIQSSIANVITSINQAQNFTIGQIQTSTNFNEIINGLESVIRNYSTIYGQKAQSIDGAFTEWIKNTDTFAKREQIKAEQTKVNKLFDLIGKVLGSYEYLRSYLQRIKTIGDNELALYHTFSLESDCELGWIIDKNSNIKLPKPVLIITGAANLSKSIVQWIETGSYKYTTGIDTEVTVTMSEVNKYSYIGYYGNNENDPSVISLSNMQKIISLEDPMNTFIGTARADSLTVNSQPVEISTYNYLRVYPRLYIKSLKLQNSSEKLMLKLNDQLLENNKDYTVIQDDRSEGKVPKGIGYYITLKTLYDYLYKTSYNDNLKLDIMYTLSNADVSIYLDAIQVSKENSKPKVSYNIELAVLNPEFIHTAYNRLNQIIYINDIELKLDEASGYISTVTLELDKPWEDSIEIKNYETKFEDLFSTIVAQTAAMKKNEGGLQNAIKAFSATGFLNENILQDSIFNADMLNLQFDKGKLVIDQENGIWGISDDGNSVIAFRGGGIFTATSRDENGNWNWNTGILPSGINASLITAGQLDTNKIKVYAGNELRFQLNGSGFYAYKNAEAGLNQAADYKQYLVYDSEGLFLTAKKGTRYYYTVDGSSIPAETKTDVNRVEVSWDGFILRNWNNEKVFYADPDTGNLSLTGTITAIGGSIGGWTVQNNYLEGEFIHLVGSSTNELESGIYLTKNGQLRANTAIDNEGQQYYLCTPIEGITYYVKVNQVGINLDGEEFTISKDKVYIQDNSTNLLSVIPRYQRTEDTVKAGSTTSTGSGEYDEQSGDLSINANATGDIVTKIYVMLNNSSNNDISNYALDSRGEKIIYYSNEENASIERDTNPETAVWFEKLSNGNIDNYMQYVIATYETTYEPIGTSSENITLMLQGSKDITFSVKARDGEVTILKGDIGGFTVNDTGLDGGANNSKITNTTFDKSNKLIIEGNSGQSYTFGHIFYDIESDSEAGTFTLKRINGQSANFNIAAMAAYRRAIAAASAITLELTVSG